MFDYSTKNIGKKMMDETITDNGYSTESIFPLVSVENGFVYVRDGSKEVVLTFPGKDTSVMNEDQQERYAEDISRVLSGITGDVFSFSWIPEKISSEANLNLARQRLEELKKQYYNEKMSPEKKASVQAVIRLLQEHVIPEIQLLALSSSSVQGNLYLWIKYNNRTENEITNDIIDLTKKIEGVTGRNCEWIKSTEVILNLIENWCSNSQPLDVRKYDPTLIMPDYMKNKNRRR